MSEIEENNYETLETNHVGGHMNSKRVPKRKSESESVHLEKPYPKKFKTTPSVCERIASVAGIHSAMKEDGKELLCWTQRGYNDAELEEDVWISSSQSGSEIVRLGTKTRSGGQSSTTMKEDEFWTFSPILGNIDVKGGSTGMKTYERSGSWEERNISSTESVSVEGYLRRMSLEGVNSDTMEKRSPCNLGDNPNATVLCSPVKPTVAVVCDTNMDVNNTFHQEWHTAAINGTAEPSPPSPQFDFRDSLRHHSIHDKSEESQKDEELSLLDDYV